MAAPAEIITDARPSAISLRWIINGREDLIWLSVGLVPLRPLLLYLKGSSVGPWCTLGDTSDAHMSAALFPPVISIARAPQPRSLPGFSAFFAVGR